LERGEDCAGSCGEDTGDAGDAAGAKGLFDLLRLSSVREKKFKVGRTQKRSAVVLAGVVAGPALRGILVAVEQGVPAAEPLVAEQTADASILLAEPVTVAAAAVVAAAAAAAVSSILAAALPIRPAVTVQPVSHTRNCGHTYLHSLLLRLLLIWVE